MSEHADDAREDDYEYEYVPGGRRRKGRGAKGCLAVLLRGPVSETEGEIGEGDLDHEVAFDPITMTQRGHAAPIT